MQRLSAEQVEETLIRNGVGVLALFDGTSPYAIPMSFGFDGSRPVFSMQMGVPEGSTKRLCLETTTRACFTVYERVDADTWRSVVLTGGLSEIPDENADSAYAALASNAEFAPDLDVWGVPVEEVELRLYGLSIDDCEGREFGMR